MAKLETGDHVWVSRKAGIYSHHGIYAGGGQVIHYAGEPGQEGKRNSPIQRTTLEDFAKGGGVKILKYRLCYKPEEVIARAEGMIGQKQYDLSVNNCEHFAFWCKTGRAESPQVSGYGGLAGGIGGGVLGAAGAVAAVSATGTVAGLSAAGITSGLAAVGTVIGGGMVAGVAVLAFAPVASVGVGFLIGRKVWHWWQSESGEMQETPLLPPPSECEVLATPDIVPLAGEPSSPKEQNLDL